VRRGWLRDARKGFSAGVRSVIVVRRNEANKASASSKSKFEVKVKSRCQASPYVVARIEMRLQDDG